MKLKQILAVAALGTALLMGTAMAKDGEFGLVSMQQVAQQSTAMKAMQQQMQTSMKPEQAKLNAAMKQVNATRAKLQKATGAEKTKLAAQLKAEQASFQSKMSSYQQMQRAEQTKFKSAITDAMNAVAKKQHLGGIFLKQAVLASGDAFVDVTSQVITQLDKK